MGGLAIGEARAELRGSGVLGPIEHADRRASLYTTHCFAVCVGQQEARG
jgi:hypothetical protein